jgi:hypothetical protein
MYILTQMVWTLEDRREYARQYRKANLAYYAERSREYNKLHPRKRDSTERLPILKSNYLYKISISYERAVKDLFNMKV